MAVGFINLGWIQKYEKDLTFVLLETNIDEKVSFTIYSDDSTENSNKNNIYYQLAKRNKVKKSYDDVPSYDDAPSDNSETKEIVLSQNNEAKGVYASESLLLPQYTQLDSASSFHSL
jgi:hypothetical protein